MTSTCPELADYHRQFEEAEETARHLTEGLTKQQLDWRPAPGRWSIAECLGHLNVTAEAYIRPMDAAIARAKGRGEYGKAPFRHGFLVNAFIRMLEPPPRRRFKSPSKFVPGVDTDGAVENFLEYQHALMVRSERAEGLHLGRIRITSPITRLLRMSLGQCFRLLATHQRRHLWQAQQIPREPGFPKSQLEGSVNDV